MQSMLNIIRRTYVIWWYAWGCDKPTLKGYCCNPTLGLATKAKACKGASQEGGLGVTSHAPENVREYERMKPHTPKWALTLGVGVSMDF
jgi:hypothetical protein